MIIEDEQIQKKVKNLKELEYIVQKAHEQKKKVVLCHGVFDGGIHPGHTQYFSSSKREGDILIVTVTKDEYVDRGPGRPVIPDILRAENVGALACVDYVAINPYETAVETILQLKPDIYAKGEEFAQLKDDAGKIVRETKAIQDIGGRMHFTTGIQYSSSAFINNNEALTVYTKEARSFLSNFRNKYTSEHINDQLKSLKSLEVLVVGETIIDEYHYCKPLGKAPKENMITYQFLYDERFAGGAAATANHIAGFCDNVHLVSLLGKEESDYSFICKNLKPNIIKTFHSSDTKPTTKKRRGVDPVSFKKQFGQYFINDEPISSALEESIIRDLKKKIPTYDLVVVSDYGHGFITSPIISLLCEKSKFLAINVQSNSSNMGFNLIDNYPRADYFCIDHEETRLAARDRFSDLQTVHEKIMKLGKYSKSAITEGHKGSLTYSPLEGYCSIPVFSNHVIDTMGAGDAYFSLTTPCAAREFPMDMLGFIGNSAGALAVEIVGHRTSINPGSLYKFITTLLK